MGKDKLLYVMHVPWGWIKQRPHFVAEELSKYYDVTVLTEMIYKDSENHVCNNTNLNIKSLFRLPFKRYIIIKYINELLFKIQLFFLKKKDYKFIWIMSPSQYDFTSNVKDKIVIYDCMDDMLEFANDEHKNGIMKQEQVIFNNANIFFCSSKYLKETLIKRYGKKDITVVNNAIRKIGGEPLPELDSTNILNNIKNKYILTYIGTISEWIDFELLKKITDTIPNIVVCLFGPKGVDFQESDNIIYGGVVEHSQVFPIMNKSDFLIMPFICSKLILSVNPVKLYEYIYSAKPSLAPRYGETEQFEEYVHLYDSHNGCIRIIKSIMNKEIKNKSLEECIKYANTNTWEDRVQAMQRVIYSYNGMK